MSRIFALEAPRVHREITASFVTRFTLASRRRVATRLLAATTANAGATATAARATLAAMATLTALVGCTSTDDGIAVGTVERDRIELASSFLEPLTARHVEEGIRVAAGTLVAEQSQVRINAQLRRAEAERDRTEARLAELIRGPRQELVREGMARVDRAEALRRDAELELKRVSDLIARGFASVAQVDQLKAQRDSAVASLAEAQANLDSLVTGTTAEELAQARAALAAAVAQIDELNEQANRLNHIAPVDAIVEALPYEVGEIPPVGAPVAVLLRADAPFARVYVPEQIRARIKPGTRASIHVDGIETPLPGRIRYLSHDASFTPYFALTRHDRGRLTYVAEVDFETDNDIPAGTPLEVRFDGVANE